MSTKQRQLQKIVAPPSNSKEDDDVGALIYREFQLRKAEAAAAAERKKTSIAFTHNKTSTRKRSPVANQGEESLPRPQRRVATKGRKRVASLDQDQPKEKVAKKRRYECSADGCMNQAKNRGVCRRHGARAPIKQKLCSSEGCTDIVVNGGVCVRHGAKRKLCSSEGCTNQVRCGGLCLKHGAKIKLCSSEGCTNIVVNGGVCVRHGAKRVEECVLSMEQRSNVAAAKDAQILPSKEECA
eukprot:scaffold1323_cov106-Skeletonema_marinoi.AAC.9